MLTQLRNWILRSLDINLPMIKLLRGPSITALSAELLAQLNNGAGDAATTTTTKNGTQSSATFTLADLDGVRVLSPWLIRGSSNADAPFRLICFHSMGVGASLFTKFLLHPPGDFDILAVQTPGRENRLAEPVVKNVGELADQIVSQLVPFFDRPVVIWGHSFGGITAFEVIRRLRERYQLEPIHFVVTGTMPPHDMPKWQKREVMKKVMVGENTPEYIVSLSRYVDDPEFVKDIIPLMRTDWPLCTNYSFQQRSPLSCPITAFAARQDDMVYTDEIRDWAQHTDGGFELIEVDGDHWFLNRNRERIIAAFHQIAARSRGTAGPHRNRSVRPAEGGVPAQSASSE